MARMSLDTAIRLSAEVKGGANITKVQRSLQDLAKGSQTTAREMSTLRAATFQFARANDSTIAGIRSSIGAFRGLQEQAKIGSREFQRYGAEIQKLEGKLRGLDTTATAAGDSLGKKLATGLAAAGIGRGLQQITMQAGKFDAEVRKAAAIEGGAGSFSVLQKEIEKVAAVAAGTPTEVAALATSLSRAGFSAQETTQSLAGIVRGAEATAVSFEEMGSIAADNMRAFGLETSQVNRVVDILTQAANKSNQGVLDVGEAMKYSAPVAKTLGVSIEDLAATLGLMANAGIRGSDAGTGLRMGLFRLQTAAGGADEEIQSLTRGNALLGKAMDVLGAQILDTQGKLKPMDQVILALKDSFAKLSISDQAILAKALFGTEAASKFLATMNFTESKIQEMFGFVRNAGGVAEETQKKMQGFNYSIVVAGGNVEYLANQIGGMIGAAMKPLIDTFNLAISAAMKLPDPIRNIGAAAAAAGISTLGLVVAVNAVSGALALVGGVSGAKAAIAGLTNFSAAATVARNAAVALNLAVLGPWALAAAGIAAATAAAYKFNEPFREFVNTIPARFGVFFQALQRDVQAAAARAQAVIASVRNFAVNAFRAVESVGRQAMQNLLNTLNPVDAAFRQLGINIQSIFGGVFESIGINWGRLISQMLGQLNPMQGILKLLGVDMAGAMEQALNFRPSAAPQAAALPATAPIPGTLPGAPPAPALPGGGGGGGGAAGGGGSAGSAPKFELSSRGRALVAAAQKLGVSPLDLATIISFETAGTFSPSIRGGTGNNYMGLIQFGAPERQKYGASPNQSFEEQVMGPVVRYFQDRFKGVGMSTQGASLLDLYTTVLAGNPKANRNARDSFGTSAVSGVNNMGPHRQKALSTFFGGSMENVGFGAVEQAQATTAGYEEAQQAAEQLRERQQATTAELEKFIEARTQAVVKLNQESELLGATTDLDRRRLEYAFEQLEINDRAIQAKREFQELEKQLVELGIDYNAEQQLARIESEKQHALKNAQVKAEQDINDLMAERVRMMQQLTRQAAEPAAFQTQGMAIEAQIATLKDDLAEMTSIATLAGKSAETIGGAFGNAFRDLISGAASARQVLAGFFEDVAQGFAQMAAEIIAKQMAMIALQTILKALGAVAGGGSTFAAGGQGGISPALGFDPGGFAAGDTGIPFFGRALGGGVSAGRPYPVGENGPELFVPYQAGSIIPAEATEALEAINNASLRGLSVPFQATAATAAKTSQQGGGSSSSSGLSVPFQRGMEGLSVPFQRGGMDGSAAAGGGAAGGNGLIRFETVQIGELDFVTKDEAQRIGRESAKQGAALAQKRITNNPTARRQAGLS
jgi:TP901 family phage tail tape measure protein